MKNIDARKLLGFASIALAVAGVYVSHESQKREIAKAVDEALTSLLDAN